MSFKETVLTRIVDATESHASVHDLGSAIYRIYLRQTRALLYPDQPMLSPQREPGLSLEEFFIECVRAGFNKGRSR